MEGRKCKAYLNNGGTYASPTWLEGKRMSDVKLPSSRGSSDVKVRGSENVKTALGYMKNGVSFTYKCKRPGLTDTFFAALQTAYRAGSIIDMAFMDQAIATSGATGVRGPFVITKFDRNEADEDAVTYDVELAEAEDEQPAGTEFKVAAFTIS